MLGRPHRHFPGMHLRPPQARVPMMGKTTILWQEADEDMDASLECELFFGNMCLVAVDIVNTVNLGNTHEPHMEV